MNQIASWVLQAMIVWVPPSMGELPRYEDIAEDLVRVAVEAPLFPGPKGKEETAIYLAAIASYESFYREDVDNFSARGDHGKAWGLLQVHLVAGEACKDRLGCLRIGRERARSSFRECRNFPEMDRLSRFTTGKCMHNPESRYRLFRAKSWFRRFPYREVSREVLLCTNLE